MNEPINNTDWLAGHYDDADQPQRGRPMSAASRALGIDWRPSR